MPLDVLGRTCATLMHSASTILTRQGLGNLHNMHHFTLVAKNVKRLVINICIGRRGNIDGQLSGSKKDVVHLLNPPTDHLPHRSGSVPQM